MQNKMLNGSSTLPDSSIFKKQEKPFNLIMGQFDIFFNELLPSLQLTSTLKDKSMSGFSDEYLKKMFLISLLTGKLAEEYFPFQKDGRLKNIFQENMKHIVNIIFKLLMAGSIDGWRRYGKIIAKLTKDLTNVASIMSSFIGIPKVVLYGSARIPEGNRYNKEAMEIASLIERSALNAITIHGGGPGLMEAFSRGHQLTTQNPKTVAFGITLPWEQKANPYVAEENFVECETFAARKIGFLHTGNVFVVFPGGFGTHDELWETLTMIQTGRKSPVPVILYGKKYWEKQIQSIKESMFSEKTASAQDILLLDYADKPQEVMEKIYSFYFAYHSLKHLDKHKQGTTVLRLKFPVQQELLDMLNSNEEYKANLLRNEPDAKFLIRDIEIYPIAERTEFKGREFTYLEFPFNKRKYGYLHKLINEINAYYLGKYPDFIYWREQAPTP